MLLQRLLIEGGALHTEATKELRQHSQMFIVHDHREIPDILRDPKDERVELAFMRRQDLACWFDRRAPQLKGNIAIICENITDSNVSKTEILLLNENVLHSIDGIGLFHNSPLKLLSLSSNCLESLPEEVCLVFSPKT